MGGIVSSVHGQVDRYQIKRLINELYEVISYLDGKNPNDEGQVKLDEIQTSKYHFRKIKDVDIISLKIKRLFELVNELNSDETKALVQLHIEDSGQVLENLERYKDAAFRHRMTLSVTLNQFQEALADIHERQYLYHTPYENAVLIFLKTSIYETIGDVINTDIAKREALSILQKIELAENSKYHIKSSVVKQINYVKKY